MTRTEKKYKKVRKALSQADFPKNSVISFSVRRAIKTTAFAVVFLLFASAELVLWFPGYEFDERSSLGERGERRRWREERPERVAAVYIFKAALTAAENIGHRNRGETHS